MTGLEKLLSKTRAAADQRAAATEREYWELVRKVATGTDSKLSPELILSKLDEMGRDVGEFEKAAALMARRIGLKADADRLAERRRQLGMIEAKIADAHATCERAIQEALAKRAETLAPLTEAEAAAKAVIGTSESAVRSLADSCPYPEVRERLQEAMKARDVAQRRLGEAEAKRKKDIDRVGTAWQKDNLKLADKARMCRMGQYAADLLELDQQSNAALKAELERLDAETFPELREELRKADAAITECDAGLLTP